MIKLQKEDKPITINANSQISIDYDNILEITFLSNGQKIKLSKKPNGELEIVGVNCPEERYKECKEKTKKHFQDIMKIADEIDVKNKEKHKKMLNDLINYHTNNTSEYSNDDENSNIDIEKYE